MEILRARDIVWVKTLTAFHITKRISPQIREFI